MNTRAVFMTIPMLIASLIFPGSAMEAVAQPDVQAVISHAKALLRDGNALNDKGMIIRAHEMLKAIHDKSPARESLYFLAQAEYELIRLGVGDDESGLYDRFIDPAIEKVESLMQKYGELSESLALFSMVQGYRIARNPLNAFTAGPKAYSSAEEAVRLDSTNPRAWLVRGIAKLNTPSIFGGDKNAALSSLRRAIAIFEEESQGGWNRPDWGYLDALVWTGWTYEQMNRPAEAQASYLKALSTEPRAAWIRSSFLEPLRKDVLE